MNVNLTSLCVSSHSSNECEGRCFFSQVKNEGGLRVKRRDQEKGEKKKMGWAWTWDMGLD